MVRAKNSSELCFVFHIFLRLNDTGVLIPENVWVSGKTARTLGFWNDLGAHATLKNGQVVENSDVIFLAVKPQMLDDALAGIKETLTKSVRGKLYVSVLIGVTLDALHSVS